MKKIQKKARQDNKGGKNADDDEKKLHVKEEEHSTYCFKLHCVLINTAFPFNTYHEFSVGKYTY